jgi:integrase
VEQVDKLTIEEYIRSLFSLPASKYGKYKDRESLSSGTITQKLVAVKNYLKFTNYVYDLGIDASKIKMNKVRYQRCDSFSEEEIKEMIKAVNNTEKYELNRTRLKLLIMIAYTSGMRLNEIRNLTIQQVME